MKRSVTSVSGRGCYREFLPSCHCYRTKNSCTRSVASCVFIIMPQISMQSNDVHPPNRILRNSLSNMSSIYTKLWEFHQWPLPITLMLFHKAQEQIYSLTLRLLSNVHIINVTPTGFFLSTTVNGSNMSSSKWIIKLFFFFVAYA